MLGQEIVLRIPKPEQDATVQQKASETRNASRKDGADRHRRGVCERCQGPFGKSRRRRSKGGKLTGPVRENTAKPDDPYQQLIKMKPGEITEPISYQGRYFILRRGEDVPKTFEMRRKSSRSAFATARHTAIAAELAQKVADSLKQKQGPAENGPGNLPRRQI